MAKTYAQLRQMIRDRVLGLPGWTESSVPYDRFGADPASVGHLRFAVGIPESQDLRDIRQKSAEGARVATEARIIFAARLPPKDQLSGYDAALGAELDLIQRLTAVETDASWPGEVKVWYAGSERAVSDSGEWMTITVVLSCKHLLPLS